jgi:uncharacterized protein YraI
MLKQSLIGVASALLLSSAAIADSSVVTTGNLNIRTGPGTGYHVIGVIPAGDAATVTSCLSDSSWCSVDYGGMQGWSSANYMTGWSSGNQVVYASTAPVYHHGLFGLFGSTAYAYYPRYATYGYAGYGGYYPPSYTTTYAYAGYRGSWYSPGYRTYAYTGYGGYYPRSYGLFGRQRLFW